MINICIIPDQFIYPTDRICYRHFNADLWNFENVQNFSTTLIVEITFKIATLTQFQSIVMPRLAFETDYLAI